MRYLALIALLLTPLATLAEETALKQVQLSNIEKFISENIASDIRSDDAIGLKNVYLNKKGSNKKFSLSQAMSSNINDAYDVNVFSVDEIRQQFTALLTHKENKIQVEITGKYASQIEVPVLYSSLSKGSIIEAKDLKTERMDKNALRQQAITDTERLVGKRLTRTLAAGKMISFKDIEEPIVIAKGKVITVVYKYHNMELKTIAEALENGSEGQIIKFRNTSTDKMITAMVTKNGNAIVNYASAAELAGNQTRDSGVY